MNHVLHGPLPFHFKALSHMVAQHGWKRDEREISCLGTLLNIAPLHWFLLLVVEVLPVTLSLSLLLLRSLGQCYLAVAHVLSLPIQSVFDTNPSYKPPISDVDK